MFSGIRGKFVLSSPRGKWTEERCVGGPQQRYIPGEPGNVQGRDRVGIRTVLWVPDPRGQYSGKFRFIEKPGVQDEGGRHVAKRSSDTRVAYPKVNV